MDKESWRLLLFDNAKTHFLPTVLRDKVVENMEQRGCPLAKEYPTVRCGVCLPGARLSKDAHTIFKINGIEYTFFTSDVAYYYKYILKDKPRLEFGFPYHKIHGDLHVVCLLPETRKLVLHHLEGELLRANAIAAIEAQKWKQIAGQLNKHPHLDVEVPDCPTLDEI